MSLHLLTDVLASCDAPTWSGNDVIQLKVEKQLVSFSTLRELEKAEIFVENIASQTDTGIQIAYNANKSGRLDKGDTFSLKVPRFVNRCVVAKNLADLLTISSAMHSPPKSYFLLCVEDSKQPFCFVDLQSLSAATPLIKRYHQALELWHILEGLAEHVSHGTHHLFFFGIRRTEIGACFSVGDLQEQLASAEIAAFLADKDADATRKEIFRSVLSEFLQDQKPERAFAYLLRQSILFARRLKEGLAIYLSSHSPEKLAEEGQKRYLELAEKLESVVSGMEAKSLAIPAAVLLAVKETQFGMKWTTLNFVILVSTILFLLAMIFVFLSQKAMLNLLKTTISKTKSDLKEQGLDEKNPILSESFTKLEQRRSNAQCGAWVVVGFSIVPVAAVAFAMFCAAPLMPSSYTIRLTPTNNVQIIQSSNSTPIIAPSPTRTNASAKSK